MADSFRRDDYTQENIEGYNYNVPKYKAPPLADGNKRTGRAAMVTFLVLNGHTVSASVDEQIEVILAVTFGMLDRKGFAEWLSRHIQPFS